MAIQPIGSGALQGIQRGMQGLRRAALDIATQGVQGTSGREGDFERALIELPAQANQVKASTKVLTTENQMVGTLLDIHV